MLCNDIRLCPMRGWRWGRSHREALTDLMRYAQREITLVADGEWFGEDKHGGKRRQKAA